MVTTFTRGGTGAVAPEASKPTPSGTRAGRGGAEAFRAYQTKRRAESIRTYGTRSVEYKLAAEKVAKYGRGAVSPEVLKQLEQAEATERIVELRKTESLQE